VRGVIHNCLLLQSVSLCIARYVTVCGNVCMRQRWFCAGGMVLALLPAHTGARLQEQKPTDVARQLQRLQAVRPVQTLLALTF
jgi:hypothetical protein